MEPRLPIATDVTIHPSHEFHLIPACEISVRPATAPIVFPHKLWLAISLLIALFTGNAKATSIVLFVGSDRIIIASDGIATAMADGHGLPQPFCKVRQSGKTYYAIAGDYGFAKNEPDVWELVRTALDKSKSLADVYASTRSVIMPKLKAIADNDKVAAPVRYSKFLHGDPVIEMAFAKFENGVPTVLGVTFYIDQTGKPIDPPVQNVLGPSKDNTVPLARLGLHDTIETIVKTPEWAGIFHTNIVEALRYLIQAEIDSATTEKRFDVGPPISILRITKDGSAFVDGFSGNCANTQTEQRPERKSNPLAEPPEKTAAPSGIWIEMALGGMGLATGLRSLAHKLRKTTPLMMAGTPVT